MSGITLLRGEELKMQLKPHMFSFFHLYLTFFLLLIWSYVIYDFFNSDKFSDFPFYENSYSFCAVMANGWVGFSGTNQSWNNGSVFDDDSPNGAIFAFWDDLYPESLEEDDGSGNIRYHSNSERLVIWYDNVRHWTSDERVYDFQVVLYKTGEIAINYRNMQGDVDSATIGIVDSNANYGLEVLYNQDGFIENNMSVKFGQDSGWAIINSNNSSKSPLLSRDLGW